MVKPEMYEVYLDDTAHVFRDISDEPLRWKNIKVCVELATLICGMN